MKIHLLNYLLEASVCLAVFYAFYYLVLRKERFFAYNRIFILLALLLSLLIPVMEIPLSQQAIYISQQPAIDRYVAYIPLEAAEKPADPVASQDAEASSVGLWEFVLYGYGIVAFLFLIRLFFQVKHLYSLAKGGIKDEGYTLIPTAGQLSPFSFFHWLFWDDTQALAAEEKNLILAHELVHIRQKHSWDTMLLEVLKIIFWFHPAIYLFKKALQEVHEYLADQAVLYQHDSNLYTNLLARQHLGKLSVSFTHSFNQSQVLKRIAMIQSARKSAKPAVWKLAFALPVMAILLFTYSCKTSEVTEPRPNSLSDAKGVYRLGEVIVVGYAANKSHVKELQLNEMITGYGQSVKNQSATAFERTEVPPQPVAGMKAFEQYILQNIRYPEQAEKAGIRGKVFIEFIVNADGSLSHISVVKGIGGGCDEEAVQLIKNGPAWSAGKQNGESVPARKVVAVSFGTHLPETLLAQVQLISEKPTENQPAPVDGLEVFYKHIGKNIIYPRAARADLVEGKVWVQFIVNPDGHISDVEVTESLYPELDQEVIRVVSEAGLAWKPAILNGKAQTTRVVFPVSFILGA